MKIKSIAWTAGILAVCLGAYLSYDALDNRITGRSISTQYDVATYENVDDLAKDTTLIVEATATGDTKEINYKGAGDLPDGYTLHGVKITKIIKDTTGKGEKIGNTIQLVEPIRTMDNGLMQGKTLLLAEDYTPVKENAKYIFFLNWSDTRNAYWIHALYHGKINIDGKDTEEQNMVTHHAGFKKLVESVKKKYAIQDS